MLISCTRKMLCIYAKPCVCLGLVVAVRIQYGFSCTIHNCTSISFEPNTSKLLQL